MTYIFGSTIALQRHIIMAGLKIKDFGRHPREGQDKMVIFANFRGITGLKMGKRRVKAWKIG